MSNRYLIAVYTNAVKGYCDEAFFSNLYLLSKCEPVVIVDNTTGDSYSDKLRNFFLQKNYANFQVHHLPVPALPRETQFHRNVCDSVNYLRQLYLTQTHLPYFFIVESDVIPPTDVLDRFDQSINRLNRYQPDWGIIGGQYYAGFHAADNLAVTAPEQTGHCLSGCTVYKRALIEKFPFRYEPDNPGPFPDAFICFDARETFSFWNDPQIRCNHLFNPANGLRTG